MNKVFLRKNKDWLLPLFIWLTGLIAIITTMVLSENRSVFEGIYYGIVVASTVGFGDICPTTVVSRIAAIYYIVTAILAFGILLDVFITKSKLLTRNKRKGMISHKNATDLIIIGYPSEEKVRAIIREMRLNVPESKIVCVTNQVEEKPDWMCDEDVVFIYGRASVREVLERANVLETKHILVLANDPSDITSDEYSSSAVMMCEAMNQDAHTIAEKVRPDKELFKWANCDKIVDVCRANELVQEILHPGAIDLVDTIFSAESLEVQKNIKIPLEDGGVWYNIVIELAKDSMVAVGYSADNGETFKFAPNKNTIVPANSIIKVISGA